MGNLGNLNNLLKKIIIPGLIFFLLLSGCKKTETQTISQAISKPVVNTSNITNITQTTAICGGTVTSDGGASITARGVCWSESMFPNEYGSKTTDGVGDGNFISNITGLSANTEYFVRAYATNSAGTVYGNTLSFTTYTGNITDIDGNIYNTITIGSQIWTVENLKVTHYRNGDPIPNVTDNTTWCNLTSGAYCNYDDNIVATYGHLYNWYAVVDSRNIAPAGWHIPSDAEWQTLIDYLGGNNVAGGEMKEAGTFHWSNPNTSASNESGFTGLPGGDRGYGGSFSYMGGIGNWWSSTEYSTMNAWYIYLSSSNAAVNKEYNPKYSGYSVRCIKN